MTNVMPIVTSEKFQNAEQLWFWFLYSRAMRNDFAKLRSTPTTRPCEILDVETLITKLYLCGKLTDEQLAVMKKFGDKRRAPHQYIWSENRDAIHWNDAMKILGDAAKQRGWLN